jgi:hypothetical protein
VAAILVKLCSLWICWGGDLHGISGLRGVVVRLERQSNGEALSLRRIGGGTYGLWGPGDSQAVSLSKELVVPA